MREGGREGGREKGIVGIINSYKRTCCVLHTYVYSIKYIMLCQFRSTARNP